MDEHWDQLDFAICGIFWLIFFEWEDISFMELVVDGFWDSSFFFLLLLFGG